MSNHLSNAKAFAEINNPADHKRVRAAVYETLSELGMRPTYRHEAARRLRAIAIALQGLAICLAFVEEAFDADDEQMSDTWNDLMKAQRSLAKQLEIYSALIGAPIRKGGG
jgi:hypothetical protein